MNARHDPQLMVGNAADTAQTGCTEHRGRPNVSCASGGQDFVATAPLNLIYVANYARMPDITPEQQLAWRSTDVGFSVENAYRFCASFRLATVVRGSIDREALGKALGLSSQQRVILGQSAGFPA